MRISGFGGRGHLTPLLPPYKDSLSFRRPIWLGLPSDSALALNNRASLLGSYREFLWTPLPSPTFSLLTGQWLDFHQLADYHASRTAPTSSKRPAPMATRGSSYTAPLALRFLYSFGVTAPSYPLVDLPLSFALDSLFSPLTAPPY